MSKHEECIKHQKGIEAIVSRLETNSKTRWDGIEPRYVYGLHDEIGEIDVLAGKGDRFFIFEYKCRDSEHARYKAEDQLARAKWWLEMQGYRVTPFYVHDNMIYEYQVL